MRRGIIRDKAVVGREILRLQHPLFKFFRPVLDHIDLAGNFHG